MASPLLVLVAVFLGLWITGIELKISTMTGMTMIAGIVTEIAIFYFSELTEAHRRMPLHESMQHAGHHRMRPILMSTLAAILSPLPLTLAIGQGSQTQQPRAVAIISGMEVRMLLVMPVIYATLGKSRQAPPSDDTAPAGARWRSLKLATPSAHRALSSRRGRDALACFIAATCPARQHYGAGLGPNFGFA